MEKLLAGVSRFLREEEGTEVVEWALVAGLVVAVGATVFSAIGIKVETILQSLDTLLGTATADAGTGG